MRVLVVCALSVALISVADTSFAQDEKREYMTAEEIMKSKAGQLYATRRFAEALEEFRTLSQQWPKDIVLKRYIGACLDHLKRDEEAIVAFQEALKLDPNDLPSRQFLANIHLRSGELDKAEEHIAFISERDKRGTYTAWARGQLDAIQRIRKAGEAMGKMPGRQILPQDFVKTGAAIAFMNAKYEEALRGFEELEKTYSQDVLVKRYKSITLDRMGRSDEALATIDGALALVPDNVALHYFRAQMLLHKQDYEGSKKELEYVTLHDEVGTYKARADVEIPQVVRIIEVVKRARPRPWSVSASAGAEWNSNPATVTRVDALRTSPKNSSWKFSNTLGTSYQFLKKGTWTLKGTYNYSHALYSDSLSNLSTVGNSFGVNATYVRSLRGKPLLAQIGHSTSHTMLRHKFYSVAYSESLTLIYSLRDWYRMTLSERWTYSEYDSDGSAPDSTGRDGFGNVLGLTNNFYLNKEKTLSLLLGMDYGRDDPQGINYLKNEFAYRTALHFPLAWKWEGDLSFKFKDSQYPKYGFPVTTPGRRDLQYVLGVGLLRPLGRYWTLNANYSYTDNNSRDDNFTYRAHAFALSLSFSY